MTLPVAGLVAILALVLPAEAEVRPCPAPTETARVAAVVDDGDVALEDGRTLKLAGLDPARATPVDPALGERLRHKLDAWLVGQDIGVVRLAEADRWERFPALVFGPASESAAESLNARLVAQGWARVRPEPSLRACLGAWLTFEDRARRAGLGLWADPYYAIVDADDAAGLKARAGGMVLAQGRLSVSETRGRLVLRFGGTAALTASFAHGGAKGMARLGLDPRRLSGRMVRARGWLDERFGPRIDLIDAGQIEVLDAPPDGR